jgi:hypothetical protein
MKTIGIFIVGVLLMSVPTAAIPQQCTCDASRFTMAKLAIAKRVLQQMKDRQTVCESQPKEKQGLCVEWAEASNEAAKDIQAVSLAEIDKLAAH